MLTDTASFTFVAHVVNTTRQLEITIEIQDDGERPFVEMADEAEECAYEIAARKLGVPTVQIEVMSA